MPGSIGVGEGVTVSVCVGAIVSVIWIAVSVEVGRGVGLISTVAVAGMAVWVGSGFCKAPIICGETDMRAAIIVPVTPRIAITKVWFSYHFPDLDLREPEDFDMSHPPKEK
jgi:hypothetical protein